MKFRIRNLFWTLIFVLYASSIPAFILLEIINKNEYLTAKQLSMIPAPEIMLAAIFSGLIVVLRFLAASIGNREYIAPFIISICVLVFTLKMADSTWVANVKHHANAVLILLVAAMIKVSHDLLKIFYDEKEGGSYV